MVKMKAYSLGTAVINFFIVSKSQMLSDYSVQTRLHKSSIQSISVVISWPAFWWLASPKIITMAYFFYPLAKYTIKLVLTCQRYFNAKKKQRHCKYVFVCMAYKLIKSLKSCTGVDYRLTLATDWLAMGVLTLAWVTGQNLFHTQCSKHFEGKQTFWRTGQHVCFFYPHTSIRTFALSLTFTQSEVPHLKINHKTDIAIE